MICGYLQLHVGNRLVTAFLPAFSMTYTHRLRGYQVTKLQHTCARASARLLPQPVSGNQNAYHVDLIGLFRLPSGYQMVTEVTPRTRISRELHSLTDFTATSACASLPEQNAGHTTAQAPLSCLRGQGKKSKRRRLMPMKTGAGLRVSDAAELIFACIARAAVSIEAQPICAVVLQNKTKPIRQIRHQERKRQRERHIGNAREG